MNDIYVLIGQGLLTLLSVFFAYRLGLSKERERHEKEENDAVLIARKARAQLADPKFVERLHAKYKR